MTDVRWSLFVEDAPVPSVKDVTSIISDPWADQPGNAATTIAMIIDDWFGEHEWREWFGEDWTGGVEVEVHSPPHLAGRWGVDLRLKVDSTARRI
jgi:hypothetical protein